MSELTNEIYRINKDLQIHACIIQLPLPKKFDSNHILNLLDPTKDVDCFHSSNIGRLLTNPQYHPATPFGIKLLLEHYKIPTRGRNCVIIGKSIIVGTPMAREDGPAATVTMCDRYTDSLKQYVALADILIVATGVHHLIDQKFTVKKSVTIVDVGIHRVKDSSKKAGYRLEGDVDFSHFKDKCAYITPVPGVVGPMTVYSLLHNIYLACYHKKRP